MSFELLASGKESRIAHLCLNPSEGTATVRFAFLSGDRVEYYSSCSDAKMYLESAIYTVDIREGSAYQIMSVFFSAEFMGTNPLVGSKELLATARVINMLNKRCEKKTIEHHPGTLAEHLKLIQEVVGVKEWHFSSITSRNVKMESIDQIISYVDRDMGFLAA